MYYFSGLLGYNWHITVRKFKVYNNGAHLKCTICQVLACVSSSDWEDDHTHHLQKLSHLFHSPPALLLPFHYHHQRLVICFLSLQICLHFLERSINAINQRILICLTEWGCSTLVSFLFTRGCFLMASDPADFLLKENQGEKQVLRTPQERPLTYLQPHI